MRRRPALKILDKALAAARKKRALALRAERMKPVTDGELRERFQRYGEDIYKLPYMGKVNLDHPRGWIKVRKHKITFERLNKVIL